MVKVFLKARGPGVGGCAVHPILHFGNVPDLASALLVAGIGLAVLLARPRDPANVYFAAFMGFLAWGIAAGVSYLHAVEELVLLRESGSASAEQLHQAALDVAREQRLFWIPIIFDPITLLYFASVYPRRNRLHRAAILVPFALVALALLAIDVLLPFQIGAISPGQQVGPFASNAVRSALTLYMLAAYVLALGGLLELLWSGGVTRQRAKLLLIGLGIAVFTRVGLTLEDFPANAWVSSVSPLMPAPNVLIVRTIELLLSLAAFYVFYRILGPRAPPEARGTIAAVRRATFLGVLGVGLLVWIPAPLMATIDGSTTYAMSIHPLPLRVVERMRYSARWLVFGSVVGYSILRFQLFDLSSRARRAVLHTSLLITLLSAFAIVASVMATSIANVARPELLLVLAVAASTAILLAYEAAKSRVGRHLREPDPTEVRARKMDVYRAAAEATPEQTERLEALREELGLTAEEARTVELLARAPRAGGPLAPGLTVGGRYAIERLLGRGGGGRVFLARDSLIDRLVVLKEIDGVDDANVQRALAEAKHAGGLSHPNVVVLHDTILWGGRQILVMEYVAGGSLDAKLRAEGPLPPDDALRLMRGVLSGLAAVHASGIAHGDVKPGNVLLAPDGTPKLSDFGIAALQRHGTLGVDGETPTRALTLRYAAPEILAGARASARGDVYAAALVLADALVGLENGGTAVERVRAACSMLPGRVAALLAAAASLDPAGRPEDASAMLAALQSVQ